MTQDTEAVMRFADELEQGADDLHRQGIKCAADDDRKAAKMLRELATELDALKAQPVKVKALVWKDYPLNGEPVISMSVTEVGTYFICDDTDDFTGLYLEFVGHKDATWYGTVKADCIELSAHNHIDDYSPLQAAAQVDYEQRILSAITTKTEAEVREECIEDIKKARQALKEK